MLLTGTEALEELLAVTEAVEEPLAVTDALEVLLAVAGLGLAPPLLPVAFTPSTSLLKQ